MLSCVYDTAIHTIYGFKYRSPPPSRARERAGVLHAACASAQDRAAHRAPPRAGEAHHAPAQGCVSTYTAPPGPGPERGLAPWVVAGSATTVRSCGTSPNR